MFNTRVALAQENIVQYTLPQNEPTPDNAQPKWYEKSPLKEV